MKKLTFACLFCVFVGLCAESSAQTFRTGVNMPLFNPDERTVHQYLALMAQAGMPAARQFKYADAYWKQVEPADDAWNFVFSDSAFFNPYGVVPVGGLFSMLGPNDTLVGLQAPWKACGQPFTCYWKPEDSLETIDYIRTVVQRYASTTRYWEIANEMESALPPRGLRNIFEQSRFLNYCYRWIKDADPNAVVVFPGILGTYGYPMSQSFHWLREMMGAQTRFDVMNFHDYNAWWTLCAHYDSVKNILNERGLGHKPIWVTETGVSSSGVSSVSPGYSSPDEQAADVWRRTALLWGKGAQAVFWHSGWGSPDLNEWGGFGLVTVDGKKKKSFHAFQLLNEKAAAFDSVKITSLGNVSDDNENGGNGVWVVEFTFGNDKKWLMWSPDGQSYTLNKGRLAVTRVVPAELYHDGDSAVFVSDTFDVSGESYTLALTSLPVWVEEIRKDSVVSVMPELFASAVRVFPNPVSQTLRIEGAAIRRLRIWDATGKTVCQKHFWNSHLHTEIDVRDWPSGTYAVEINGRTQKTFVVVNDDVSQKR